MKLNCSTKNSNERKYETMPIINKKVEELLNLPPMESFEPLEDQNEIDLSQEDKAVLAKADDVLDKIDAALPSVKELSESDTELDELSNLAKESFKDLLDLGMQVEPRHSGQIFQTASTLLGHAITAKTAKIEKKLRMVDLQIKKRRLDIASGAKDNEPEDVSGEARVVDRNELLSDVLAHIKENNKNN